MQVASQIFPFFEIPNWVVRLVVLLLILGFPVVLIIAMGIEVTPEGIQRTEAADAAGQRISRRRLDLYCPNRYGALGRFVLCRPLHCWTCNASTERSGYSDSTEIDRGAAIS